MALGDRGLFFTITAILLAGFAIITLMAVTKQDTNGHAVQTRILTLDHFLSDTKKDFDRALNIGSFRTILGLEDYMIEKGVFLDDINGAFSAALMNATYNGESLGIVENATLTAWRNRIEAQAASIGLTLNIELESITLEQVSPWDLKVTADAHLTLSDTSGLASFEDDHTGSTIVSIVGFEDPVYLLNSYGRVTNVINQTPYENFIVGNSTANLLNHISQGYYLAHNDSPSFLMRLQGILNSSPYGIESLVNQTALANQDVPTKTASAVDYLYFGNTSTSNTAVPDTPTWFLLDDAHVDVYD